MRSPARAALAAAVLLLTLAALPLAAQESGRVRGEIVSEETWRPLGGASVEVWSRYVRTVVHTDSLGRYVLTSIPAGRHSLRVRHLSHAPLEVEIIVPAGGEVALDLALRAQPLVLQPVTVEVAKLDARADTASASAAELARAASRSRESSPALQEFGFAESSRGPPGQEPVDPSDVLFVRGAAADLKLVLLDGAPVYSPFHLGGLIPPFEPGVLRTATLHVGGAPARYDGGLAYIMELETRRARGGRPHLSGSVDALTAGAFAETPLGANAALLMSGRTVHGLGVQPMLERDLPYGYDEGLVRLDVDLAERHSLRVTAFGNREAVRLGRATLSDSTARWANASAALRYRAGFTRRSAETTLALSSFDARLPLGGPRNWLADGNVQRVRFTSEVSESLHSTELRYGVSGEHLALRTQIQSNRASGEIERYDDQDAASSVGSFVDLTHRLSDRLRLRAGLRADWFSLDSELRLAPRFSAWWLVGDNIALTVAAGRYHQQVRSPDSAWIAVAERNNLVELPPPFLVVAEATHFSVGLNQQFGHTANLGLEGYYKEFGRIPGLRSAAAASGMDLWLRAERDKLSGWFGYSLGWVWSLPEFGNTTESFSGRQQLSMGGSGPVARGVSLDMSLAYGSGMPFTRVALPTRAGDSFQVQQPERTLSSASDSPPLSTPPSDPYLRLDIGLSRTWEPEWNGITHRITPYLRVLNALDRRDALFYRRVEGTNMPEPLSPLPVLPVLGVRWAF
jgi:hypothetical protein